MSGLGVRRDKAALSSARKTLQPDAAGAAIEATKRLKVAESLSRIGDSASVHAATKAKR
jgi:hypothetical protein